jgi:HSP20 family protein
VTVFLVPTRQESGWKPPVDVFKTGWGWILKFELAGVRTEDIRVHISRRTVTVTGTRRDYMVEEGCSHYSMEISYSSFERAIELPDDLSKSQIRMDYRDGILFVRISLKEEES